MRSRHFAMSFLCGCIAYAAQTGLANDNAAAKTQPKKCRPRHVSIARNFRSLIFG